MKPTIYTCVITILLVIPAGEKQSFNGYEPAVTVATTKQNGKVEIKVKDNGNGIPQKVLDKIF